MKHENNHINIPWDLIITRLKGESGKDEDLLLNEWLKSDIKNQALWEELQLAWISMRKRNIDFEPDNEEAWKTISRKIKDKKIPRRKHFIRKYWQVAAACFILTTGVFIGTLFNNKTTLSDSLISYETQSGKSFLSLPDGSCIWLNANSVLQIPDDFNKTNRNVRLLGEALFDISHDSENPFIVQLNDIDVKVHGTKFNVKNPGDRENIEVTLLSGSVSLLTKDQEERFLDPGYKAIYDRSQQQISISSSDACLASLWARNKLVMDDEPLGRIVEALQVWYGRKIELSPYLKDAHFYTLTIREESLDEILRVMQKTGKFNYKIEEGKITIY